MDVRGQWDPLDLTSALTRRLVVGGFCEGQVTRLEEHFYLHPIEMNYPIGPFHHRERVGPTKPSEAGTRHVLECIDVRWPWGYSFSLTHLPREDCGGPSPWCHVTLVTSGGHCNRKQNQNKKKDKFGHPTVLFSNKKYFTVLSLEIFHVNCKSVEKRP